MTTVGVNNRERIIWLTPQFSRNSPENHDDPEHSSRERRDARL